METFAGLSVGLLILSALVVTIKTLNLWRRSRGLPELLLGGMLLCATVLGYPLTILSTLIPIDQWWPIHAAGSLAISLGFSCLVLFTLRVFRPGILWARCLAGVVIAMLVVTTGRFVVEVTGENPRRPLEMLDVALFTTFPIAVAYLWTTVESLSYYQRLKLQLRLGLTDVVVTNRVLLWGMMTLAAGIAVVINAVAMMAGVYLSPPIVLVSSCLGLVHASFLFLAFHPPSWYTAWLEQPTAAEES